ncbi:uncharacterized protein BDR25DRAFT_354939 [Lindgomyces ingoldianus]|uniref:Uncharacterized protein n=1 Tax=Lindgomyces ingoldianus TaxID=673940 RepID=A0ACB6QXL7_9PLEO|nr:uncharacterized protein BDR25DRAFT_354939 [Lindgomyces ingoldianus]KAF2471027.1 hypothetical protein BDR25DRAFT_354939 [Lindgomyces ingoldianus]
MRTASVDEVKSSSDAASREHSRAGASARPPTICTPRPDAGTHYSLQGYHIHSAPGVEATQGQSHSLLYPPNATAAAGEKTSFAPQPEALKPTAAIPALDSFKRHWYKDWFKDRMVEKSDPFGFSSTGTSRNITRTQTPVPPLEGNYEAARRNSIVAANEAIEDSFQPDSELFILRYSAVPSDKYLQKDSNLQ